MVSVINDRKNNADRGGIVPFTLRGPDHRCQFFDTIDHRSNLTGRDPTGPLCETGGARPPLAGCSCQEQ